MDSLAPIENPSTTPEPVPNPTPPSGSAHHHVTGWVALVIIAAIAATVGYLVWAEAHKAWRFDFEGTWSDIKQGDFSSETAEWKTYRNEEYGFEFKYPITWIGSTEYPLNHKTNTIVSIQDRGRIGGDTGGSLFPAFFIMKFPSSSQVPKPTEFFQALPEEIESSEKMSVVAGQLVAEEHYNSFAVEGARNITEWVEISSSGEAYVLYFTYTLAGCSVIPEDIRPECDLLNAELTKTSEQIWNQIISTFKFTEPATAVDSSVWKTYTFNTFAGLSDWMIQADAKDDQNKPINLGYCGEYRQAQGSNIFQMSKVFNGEGFSSEDPNAEIEKAGNDLLKLETNTKTLLQQNGWNLCKPTKLDEVGGDTISEASFYY